jgi:hypothetical protein
LGTGCSFASRCPNVQSLCHEARPELRDIGGRQVACHFVDAPGTVVGASFGPLTTGATPQ